MLNLPDLITPNILAQYFSTNFTMYAVHLAHVCVHVYIGMCVYVSTSVCILCICMNFDRIFLLTIICSQTYGGFCPMTDHFIYLCTQTHNVITKGSIP